MSAFPDHVWDGDQYGHACNGCPPDSDWYCDKVAHELGEHECGLKLLEATKAQALRAAADALDAQPPKLRAQYVEALRLYADEPWRLETPAALKGDDQ